jgi:predicted LPLAT superfamily acyltransferase
MSWLTVKCGRPATRWLLAPICLYYTAFAPSARRASRAFLERALGRKPGIGDVLRHQHAFASTLHDRLFFVAGNLGSVKVSTSGAETVNRVLANGRGCILVGSHLGSFEVLRTLGRLDGKVVNVVMHEANARKMQATFKRLAPELQARVIASGAPGAMLRIKECLERGEIVGILGDRVVGGERALTRSFFGRSARFPLGPWVLAAALGVPVVLFFGLYGGDDRYDVRFELVSEGGDLPRSERSAVAERWLEHYVARLEHYARGAPYNWFNFYDFWDAPRA